MFLQITDTPIISEETMFASSVIQHWTEQGMRKEAFESLMDILEFHFSHDEVQHLKPILENIEELQQLKHLRHQALQVSSLDEFRSILSSNGN